MVDVEMDCKGSVLRCGAVRNMDTEGSEKKRLP